MNKKNCKSFSGTRICLTLYHHMEFENIKQSIFITLSYNNSIGFKG